VRYLGIEVDDALEISEQIEIWTRRGCPPRTFCRRAAAYGDDAQRVLSARSRLSSPKHSCRPNGSFDHELAGEPIRVGISSAQAGRTYDLN